MKNSIKLLLLCFVSIASIEASSEYNEIKNSKALTWEEARTIAKSFQSDLQNLNCDDKENLKLISQAINFHKEAVSEVFCSTTKVFNSIDPRLAILFHLAYAQLYCSAKYNTDKFHNIDNDLMFFPIYVQMNAMSNILIYLRRYYLESLSPFDEKTIVELNTILARLFSIQAETYAIIFNKQHEGLKEILDLYRTISAGNLNSSEFNKTCEKLFGLFNNMFMHGGHFSNTNPVLNSLFKPGSEAIFTNNFAYAYDFGSNTTVHTVYE